VLAKVIFCYSCVIVLVHNFIACNVRGSRDYDGHKSDENAQVSELHFLGLRKVKTKIKSVLVWWLVWGCRYWISIFIFFSCGWFAGYAMKQDDIGKARL
jgi:hypothetical protein